MICGEPFCHCAIAKEDKGNHSAAGIAAVELHEVIGLHARPAFGLHDDALRSTGVRIVVDVGRPGDWT